MWRVRVPWLDRRDSSRNFADAVSISSDHSDAEQTPRERSSSMASPVPLAQISNLPAFARDSERTWLSSNSNKSMHRSVRYVTRHASIVDGTVLNGRQRLMHVNKFRNRVKILQLSL